MQHFVLTLNEHSTNEIVGVIQAKDIAAAPYVVAERLKEKGFLNIDFLNVGAIWFDGWTNEDTIGLPYPENTGWKGHKLGSHYICVHSIDEYRF